MIIHIINLILLQYLWELQFCTYLYFLKCFLKIQLPYQFKRSAKTKYLKLGGLNHRNVFSHSYGGQAKSSCCRVWFHLRLVSLTCSQSLSAFVLTLLFLSAHIPDVSVLPKVHHLYLIKALPWWIHFNFVTSLNNLSPNMISFLDIGTWDFNIWMLGRHRSAIIFSTWLSFIRIWHMSVLSITLCCCLMNEWICIHYRAPYVEISCDFVFIYKIV